MSILGELSFAPDGHDDDNDDDRWSNELSHSSPSHSGGPPTPDDYQATTGFNHLDPSALVDEFAAESSAGNDSTAAGSAGNDSTALPLFVHHQNPGVVTAYNDLPVAVRTSLDPIRKKYPTTYNEGFRFAAGKASPPNPPNLGLELFEKHLEWRAKEFPLLDYAAEPGTFYPNDKPDFPKKFMEVGGTAKDGSRIVAVCGGHYDGSVEGSYRTFVQRACHVMDLLFPREEVRHRRFDFARAIERSDDEERSDD